MDQTARDNAFSTILGEDYQLLKFSYPHHDQFQSTVAQQIQQHLSNKQTTAAKILEGGAGSGVTTSFLLTNQNAHIYAVDSAKAMLDQAATLLADDLDRIELIESDLLEYVQQQPDQSFDVFATVWTLHNLPPQYRAQLFPQIYRILKNSGLFISGDKYTVDDVDQHQQQLEVQLNRFRQFPTDNQDVIKGWVDHNLEDEQIRISQKEQLEILESVGFSDVQTVYRKDMEAIIKGTKPTA